MKGIIYKTDNGIVTIGATIPVFNRIKAIFAQENPDVSAEDIEQLAMTVIAEKDIPRILPPDKQELWRTGHMPLKEYLTYPLPEYRIADASEWPADKVFRGAWGFDLKEDIVKAREIRKDQIRIDRVKQFETNDIFLRDSWIENNAVAIEAGVKERDRLRDLPDLADGAKTIDELKAITVDKP